MENMKTAIRRYNRIMESIGYEYVTIGTKMSEDTEGWNLRDMVAEADYLLSTYHEDGHANEDMRRDGSEGRKCWLSETGKLERFIKAYKPFINGIKCKVGHCSQYD